MNLVAGGKDLYVSSAYIDNLAAKLQEDGAKSFVSSWNELMGVIASKSATLAKAS